MFWYWKMNHYTTHTLILESWQHVVGTGRRIDVLVLKDEPSHHSYSHTWVLSACIVGTGRRRDVLVLKDEPSHHSYSHTWVLSALDYLPVKLRVSPVYKISADFLPAGFANNSPYISQIFYVGGEFSRPTLHPAHHISANFQRTKQLFVQQKIRTLYDELDS